MVTRRAGRLLNRAWFGLRWGSLTCVVGVVGCGDQTKNAAPVAATGMTGVISGAGVTVADTGESGQGTLPTVTGADTGDTGETGEARSTSSGGTVGTSGVTSGTSSGDTTDTGSG